MLRYLSIKNFTIIDHCELDFSDGLHVITGETGSGKSVVMDAFLTLLGFRPIKGKAKDLGERTVLEGLFSLKNLREFLPQTLLDLVEGEEPIILSRLYFKDKTTLKFNGHLVPSKLVKEVFSNVVLIVGQHAQMLLFDASYHRDKLDAFGGEKLATCKESVVSVYKKIEALKKASALGDLEALKRKQDFLKFQIEDIQNQNFSLTEEKELQDLKQRWVQMEVVSKGLNETQARVETAISEAEMGDSLLSKLMDKEPEIQTHMTTLQEGVVALKELQLGLQTLSHKWADVPDRSIDDIESRLDDYFRFKQKYSVNSVEGLIDFLSNAQRELDAIDAQFNSLSHNQEELDRLCALYDECASSLSKLRKDKARSLEHQVQAKLAKLNMPGVRCVYTVKSDPESRQESGIDHVDCDVALNPGLPLKPLAKTASGGELSRFLLVLETLALSSHRKLMVFDEIDTGIGGETGNVVGDFLKGLASTNQVLCITHLTQIAKLADSHLCVEKKTVQDKTLVTVSLLDSNRRETELQRMVGAPLK